MVWVNFLSGLLHWHWDNHMIVPVLLKPPQSFINESHHTSNNWWHITTTNKAIQSPVHILLAVLLLYCVQTQCPEGILITSARLDTEWELLLGMGMHYSHLVYHWVTVMISVHCGREKMADILQTTINVTEVYSQGSIVWLTFCHCHRSAECNIVTNVTTL